MHNWLSAEFKKNKIRIDGVYYCPHHPDDNCDCRKPRLGMVKKAKADFNLDLLKSWMVGDDEKDIVLGRNAKMKKILIRNEFLPQGDAQPDFSVKNLGEAIKIILS